MNWKFWKKDKPAELAPIIEEPEFGVDPGMYGRLRHMLNFGAGGLDLIGKTPEEQAREFNERSAAEVYFETPGIVVTAADIRAAKGEN